MGWGLIGTTEVVPFPNVVLKKCRVAAGLAFTVVRHGQECVRHTEAAELRSALRGVARELSLTGLLAL